MAEWDPDVTIDGPLVRALLAEQFPQLGAQSVELVGQGFENSVWVVDGEWEWAFRFPRRAVAVDLVARELAVLPRLSPLVQIPIPVPAFVGTESKFFRRPFFGHRLLAGVEPVVRLEVVPPDARDEVLANYGPLDDEAELRARVLAIMLSTVLVLYARHEGLAALERKSLAGLERTLVDWD